MKFDLLTGGQEIKLAILVKFLLFWPLFCRFSSYFFASITFGDGFFQFQDNKVSLKQAPGHNHENTIFHLGECLFEFANFSPTCTRSVAFDFGARGDWKPVKGGAQGVMAKTKAKSHSRKRRCSFASNEISDWVRVCGA